MFFKLFKQNAKGSHGDISKITSNVAFFLLITFFLLIFLQEIGQLGGKHQIIRIVIWVSLLFSIFYQTVDFLKEDYLDGTIEQMILICSNLEIYILAKIASFWLDFCLPIIITSVIIMNIFGFSNHQIVQNSILLILSSISVSFISCLCASFNIISKRATLLVILALPIAIPVVMISIIGSIQVLASITIFLSIVFLFSCAKIIRIVSS